MRSSGLPVLGLFGLPVYRHAEAKAVDLARYWLERNGLVDRADDDAGTLPYGDQRRREIAGAVCTRPCVLSLVGPAARINPRGRDGLNELALVILGHHK